MDMLVNYIFRLACILVGAFDIRLAIVAYNEGQYFLCGFQIMFTVYMIVYLIKIIFEV